jgi:hypothetical protein
MIVGAWFDDKNARDKRRHRREQGYYENSSNSGHNSRNHRRTRHSSSRDQNMTDMQADEDMLGMPYNVIHV